MFIFSSGKCSPKKPLNFGLRKKFRAERPRTPEQTTFAEAVHGLIVYADDLRRLLHAESQARKLGHVIFFAVGRFHDATLRLTSTRRILTTKYFKLVGITSSRAYHASTVE
jgi:hypothetical protein